MVKAEGTLTIEIDGPLNEAVFFRPLNRRLRGRFDARRLAEPGALLKAWPDPIPGLRLTLDTRTGEALLSDPLAEPDHAATRARVEKTGATIEPAQQFQSVHVATWAFWMRGLVDCGLARVVSGAIPDTIDGEPQVEFITRRPVDPVERLAKAMESQNALLAELLKKR